MNNQLNIIKNAISVKNAIMLEDEQFYYVVHYDTIILKMEKYSRQMSILLPVTNSSERAIEEALIYLNMPYNRIDDEHCYLVNRVIKKELRKQWKDRRYIQPARMRKAELEENAKTIIMMEANI